MTQASGGDSEVITTRATTNNETFAISSGS
jgi:hypothetical protein